MKITQYRWLWPSPWLLIYSIPPLITFWAISRYSVDVIYVDEIFYVPRLLKLADGTFRLSDVVALHNDHRPTIPFAITAASVFSVGWHAPWKHMFSLAFSIASTYILSKLLKHTHTSLNGTTRRLLILLLITLLTSILQFGIWLQGMFLSIPLLVLFFVLALYILTTRKASWSAIASSSILSLAASLTLHQGIFVPFALLPVVFFTPNLALRRQKAITLTLIGVVLTTLYHLNYSGGRFSGDLLHGLKYPSDFLQFYLSFWGATLAPIYLPIATILGLLILLLAIFLSVHLVRNNPRATAPYISILIFIALAATVGRVWLGPGYSLRPRYLAMSYIGLHAALVHLASYLRTQQVRSRLVHILIIIITLSNLTFSVITLPQWAEKNQKLDDGRKCLKNYQEASVRCLSFLGSDQIGGQEIKKYAEQLEQNSVLSKVMK